MARARKVPRKVAPRASGGARMMASGKRPVLLGLSPEQHEKVFAAARKDERPVTQFFVFHGLKAAERILAQSPKSP